MLPFVILGACVEIYLSKTFKIRSVLTWKNFFNLLLLGLVGNIMSFGYVWSAEYTIMSHVCIFNSLGGAFIVFYRIIRK
jgi:hypothetical protein